MRFFHIEKGKFKYVNKRRIYETVKTVIMFSLAVGIYLLGYLTLKTNKNLFTVLAVLSVLPAAKSCVSMIMFLRFSSIDEALYNDISGNTGKINTIYELIFTTSERAYFVKALSCTDNTVILLYDDSKDKNSESAKKALKEHIEASLQRDGINSCSVKVYTKQSDYAARLREMNTKLKEDDSWMPVFRVIGAVTL